MNLRIMDIAIAAAVGVIVGAILALLTKDCEPGRPAAARLVPAGIATCSPPDLLATVSLGRGYLMGGCGVALTTTRRVKAGASAGKLSGSRSAPKTSAESLEPESGQPPISSDAKQAGRAADTGESGVQSSHSKESGKQSQARLARLFDAIFAHESVGGTILVGDNGKSRGPFHIQRDYWQDGGGVPKDYDRLVDDRAECEKVMLAYFHRYEPGALARGDFETLARLHNGGPKWREKPATAEYWQRVKRGQ